jgi:hypothetical protein
MPDIDHARRDLLQAVYTPIVRACRSHRLQGLEKRSLIAWLNPTAAEVASLRTEIEAASPALYEVFQGWTNANGSEEAHGVAQLASIDADALVKVAEHLVEHRARHGRARSPARDRGWLAIPAHAEGTRPRRDP